MNPCLRSLALLSSLAGLAVPAATLRADDASSPRMVRQGSAAQLLVDGKPFTILGGELHNSSASSLEYMAPIWPKLARLNLNTVLAPISWEQFEPQEGKFDDTLIDGLIAQAREQNLRLIILWFGSWKNGESSYAPAWVKKDTQRFPRVQRGWGAKPEVLSPHGDNTRDADARAFAALMRRIREIDGQQHTVIMVQVENEAGILRDSRDRSPLAEAAFAKPVPAELMKYLTANKDALIPELRRIWETAGFKTSGTWSEVFGPDADEIFTAWYMARYIETVAAAGKAEYPLPMFANAWIIQSSDEDLAKELNGFAGGHKAGEYPSGGPVSKVHDIYRAAAPHIDLLAPDIYLPSFKGIAASYARGGNPLFIPEAKNEPAAIAKAFYAIGQHGALGFSPFGIEDLNTDAPLADGYRVLADLMPLINQYRGTGKMIAVLQEPISDKGGKETVRLGDYDLELNFDGGNKSIPSYAIIISTAPDTYVIAGSGMTVNFNAATPGPKNTRILQIEEGKFDAQGKWMPARRINGDESNHNSRFAVPRGTIREVKLYRYE